MGQYHHHGYSPCVAERLGDTGSGHSPLYGFASDGYPMYGPYQAAQTLAVPCWKTRDYSALSATGCGIANARTCILNNPEDYTQGTTKVTAGPTTTTTTLSLSSNTISTASGAYFEDYYLDTACAASAGGNIYLDKNNGHDHGDALGYHYHITTDGNGNGVFPAGPGPKFHGCLPSTSNCCNTYYGIQYNYQYTLFPIQLLVDTPLSTYPSIHPLNTSSQSSQSTLSIHSLNRKHSSDQGNSQQRSLITRLRGWYVRLRHHHICHDLPLLLLLREAHHHPPIKRSYSWHPHSGTCCRITHRIPLFCNCSGTMYSHASALLCTSTKYYQQILDTLTHPQTHPISTPS